VLAVLAVLVTSASAQIVSSDAAHQQFVFAYRLLQRNETLLAIKAFDNYLGDFPKDEKRGDALYCRALLARQTGNNPAAARFLKNAPSTSLMPDYAVPLLKGQVAVDLGDHAAALAALEQVKVDALDKNIKASVFYLRGSAYHSQKNYTAAAAQFKQVADLDTPMRARSLLDLGRVLALANQRDLAIKALRRCLVLNDPKIAAEAARLAGDLAYQAGQDDQAIDFYNIVLTRYTASEHLGAAIVGVLSSHLQSGRYGQLLEVFGQHKNSLKTIEERVNGWYLAASAHQELDDHNKAVLLLRQISVNATGSKIEDMVLYKLAFSQFELSKYDDMKVTVSRLQKEHPESQRSADADFLLACAAARQGDRVTGGARLTEIINAGPTHPYYGQALMQRARMFDDGQQLAPAINDYLQFIAYARSDKANTNVEKKTVFAAQMRVIDLQFRDGKYKQAAAGAEDLLKQGKLDPLTDAEAMYRLGRAQIKLKQLDKAMSSLSGLLKKYPQNRYMAEARYYRGVLRLSQSQPDQAVADLEAAFAEPTLPDPLKINALRLVALHQREHGQTTRAVKTLLELEKLVSIDAMRTDEQLWLALYYTNQSKPRLAFKYLKPIVSGDVEVNSKERTKALLLVARGLRNVNDPDAAIAAFREVIATGHGFGLEARLELARTLASQNKLKEAIGEYEGLISAENFDIASKAIYDAAQIYRDIDRRSRRASDKDAAAKAREEASGLLLRIVLLYSRPQFSPLPELAHIDLAELSLISDDKDKAAKTLGELIEYYKDGPYVFYAKAMIMLQQNKPNDARVLLKQAQKTEDLDKRLTDRILAQLKSVGAAP